MNGELLAAYQDLEDVGKEAAYLKMAREGMEADRRAADKIWEEAALERVVLDGEWEQLVEEQEILEFENERLEEMQANMQALEERSKEVFAKEERVLELNDQLKSDLARYDVMRTNFVKKAADLKNERRQVRERLTALKEIRTLLKSVVVELAPHEALQQSESIDPESWQRLAEAIKASFCSTRNHRLAVEKKLMDANADRSKKDEMYRGKADRLVALEEKVSKLTIQGEEWQRENVELKGKVRELASAAEAAKAVMEAAKAAADAAKVAADAANRVQGRIDSLQQRETEEAASQRMRVNQLEQALLAEKEEVERKQARVDQLEQALQMEIEAAARNTALRSDGESKDATIKELMKRLAFYQKNHPSRPRSQSTESVGPERKRRREDPEEEEEPCTAGQELESPKTPPPPPRPLHSRPSRAPPPPRPHHDDPTVAPIHRPLPSNLGSLNPPPPFKIPTNSFTFNPPAPQSQPPTDGRTTSTPPSAAAIPSSSHTPTLNKSTGSASVGAEPTPSPAFSIGSSTTEATSPSSNSSSSHANPTPSPSNPLNTGFSSSATNASKETDQAAGAISLAMEDAENGQLDKLPFAIRAKFAEQVYDWKSKSSSKSSKKNGVWNEYRVGKEGAAKCISCKIGASKSDWTGCGSKQVPYYACKDCTKRGSICAIVEKDGTIRVLPIHPDKRQGGSAEEEKYWVLSR